jgi:hypothetical protein
MPDFKALQISYLYYIVPSLVRFRYTECSVLSFGSWTPGKTEGGAGARSTAGLGQDRQRTGQGGEDWGKAAKTGKGCTATWVRMENCIFQIIPHYGPKSI